MQNVIWSNDTDRIDSIIDHWKEEAARAAEDMAKDPKGAIDDAFWQVADILDRAWRQAVDDYELPTAERLIEIIEDLDPYANDIAAHAVEENESYLRDECGNLERLELDHPVVFVGTAGLWDGRRTVASVVDMGNVGEIIADSPWRHMEYETWSTENPRRVRHARAGKPDEKTLKNHRKRLDNITQMRYNGGIGKTEGHARTPMEGI